VQNHLFACQKGLYENMQTTVETILFHLLGN